MKTTGDTKLFDPAMLSAALDDAAFPVLDGLMSFMSPEPPFLTFGAPGMARALSGYGHTVLADRDPFSSSFGLAERGIEVRTAGPEDPMVFPPRRFGLVHCRWVPLTGSTVPNLTRWLKPDGVIFVETPDPYPARNLPQGPYRSVAEAVVDRILMPSTTQTPGLLMRHGLIRVGSRHESPVPDAFHTLFQRLVELGAPWPGVKEEDLRDWPHDPVAQTPALMNVLSWGMKASQ